MYIEQKCRFMGDRVYKLRNKQKAKRAGLVFAKGCTELLNIHKK